MKLILVSTLAIAGLAQSLPGDRKIASDADVAMVAFVDGGKKIAAYCTDGKVRVWDAASGALTRTIDPKSPPRGAAEFLPAMSQFAKVVADGGIELWDLNAGATAATVSPTTPRPADIAFSPDGSAVATADTVSSANTVRVRDRSGKERFAVPSGVGGISVLSFSPDGASLVGGSYDADLRVWNSRNGELVRHIQDLKVSMFAVSYSPDGKLLATAGVDRTVYLWDTQTWKLLRKFTGYKDMISRVDFSPNGRLIVTGGFDDAAARNPVHVILWDVATGKRVREMPSPHRVSSTAFSPDGKTVAAAHVSKQIDLWQVP